MTIKGTGAVFDGLKHGGKRWWILLLLFFSTVNNYLDRQVLSVMAPYISENLHLSATQYAWVINAFTAGMILGLFVAGPIMDRLGARKGFTWAVIVWCIGATFTSAVVVHNFQLHFNLPWYGEVSCTISLAFVMLMLFRFVLGVGESGNWPACSKAVAEWFPAKERGIAMGFFNGGVSVGAIIAPVVISIFVGITAYLVGGSFSDGVMKPAWMWRVPFLISILVGAPWIYCWRKIYYSPDKHPTVSKEELELIQADRVVGAASKRKEFGVLSKAPFWGLFLARGIISPVWFFIAYWIYLYLRNNFGFSLKDMALVAWIPFATADIGNIAGGYLSGKIIAHGWSPVRARISIMVLGALLMPTYAFVTLASTWWLALLLISFLTFAWGLWVSNMLTLVSDTFPSREVATVMSWTGIAQMGGTMIFTAFIGWAVDRGSWNIAILVAALLPIIGIIPTLLLNTESRIRRADAQA